MDMPAKRARAEEDDMSDFEPMPIQSLLSGAMTLVWSTFLISSLVEFSLTAKKWDPVIANVKGKGYAKRFIRDANGKLLFTGTLVHFKELKTTKAGLPQMHHTDVDPELAKILHLFVLLGNNGDAPFCVYIGDQEVWIVPGACVVFPAWVIHAGSGFVHSSRIYALFSGRALSPAEVTQAEESSESLGFAIAPFPSYPGMNLHFPLHLPPSVAAPALV